MGGEENARSTRIVSTTFVHNPPEGTLRSKKWEGGGGGDSINRGIFFYKSQTWGDFMNEVIEKLF